MGAYIAAGFNLGTRPPPNNPPTDIKLSSASVLEDSPVGTSVGTLAGVDADTGDTFTYSLVTGTGSTDNAKFSVSGNVLKTAAVLNYDAQPTYSIRVRVTDSGGLFFDKIFTVAAISINDAPTNITLSAASVPEDKPVGTTVGTLAATDPDVGDTFTYALVTGTGSTDNAKFTVSGNVLKTAAVFNYEVQKSFSIRVRVTDKGGSFYEKALTIAVTSVNDVPTNITLSPASVAENKPIGTTVGTLTATDPDAGDTFKYALVSGTGSTDNAKFTLSGNVLKTAAVFNYETKSSYSVRVRVTDGGGFYYEKILTISIINVDAPTGLSLTATSVYINKPIGTIVGYFKPLDPDTGDIFTYKLVTGTGSTNNAQFTISGNTLKTAKIFTAKTTYSIRVRVTAPGGLYFEKVFLIYVI